MQLQLISGRRRDAATGVGERSTDESPTVTRSDPENQMQPDVHAALGTGALSIPPSHLHSAIRSVSLPGIACSIGPRLTCALHHVRDFFIGSLAKEIGDRFFIWPYTMEIEVVRGISFGAPWSCRQSAAWAFSRFRPGTSGEHPQREPRIVAERRNLYTRFLADINQQRV
jgi:hypothetical protein